MEKNRLCCTEVFLLYLSWQFKKKKLVKVGQMQMFATLNSFNSVRIRVLLHVAGWQFYHSPTFKVVTEESHFHFYSVRGGRKQNMNICKFHFVHFFLHTYKLFQLFECEKKAVSFTQRAAGPYTVTYKYSAAKDILH